MHLNIKIVAIGEIKNLTNEYIKRLGSFCKLEILQLPAIAFMRESDKQKTKEKEGAKILGYIKKNSDNSFFLLDEHGQEFNSPAFAKQLSSLQGCIVFIVAGTLGFSQEIKELALPKLSLSKMTLPHEMARLVLLEQIYRSVNIINGREYHY